MKLKEKHLLPSNEIYGILTNLQEEHLLLTQMCFLDIFELIEF